MATTPPSGPFFDTDGVITAEWAAWLALQTASATSAAGSGSSFSAQIAATVLAGPTSGADAAPTFRALVASDLPSGLDAADIGAGTVSNVEYSYLDGVTSAIQAQLDATTSMAQVLSEVFLG